MLPTGGCIDRPQFQIDVHRSGEIHQPQIGTAASAANLMTLGCLRRAMWVTEDEPSVVVTVRSELADVITTHPWAFLDGAAHNNTHEVNPDQFWGTINEFLAGF